MYFTYMYIHAHDAYLRPRQVLRSTDEFMDLYPDGVGQLIQPHLWWSVIFYYKLSWCVTINHHPLRSLITYDDLRWSCRICDDLSGSFRTSSDLWRPTRTCCGLLWHIIVCHGLLQSVVVCYDLWWPIMTCYDVNCVLIYHAPFYLSCPGMVHDDLLYMLCPALMCPTLIVYDLLWCLTIFFAL